MASCPDNDCPTWSPNRGSIYPDCCKWEERVLPFAGAVLSDVPDEAEVNAAEGVNQIIGHINRLSESKVIDYVEDGSPLTQSVAADIRSEINSLRSWAGEDAYSFTNDDWGQSQPLMYTDVFEMRDALCFAVEFEFYYYVFMCPGNNWSSEWQWSCLRGTGTAKKGGQFKINNDAVAYAEPTLYSLTSTPSGDCLPIDTVRVLTTSEDRDSWYAHFNSTYTLISSGSLDSDDGPNWRKIPWGLVGYFHRGLGSELLSQVRAYDNPNSQVYYNTINAGITHFGRGGFEDCGYAMEIQWGAHGSLHSNYFLAQRPSIFGWDCPYSRLYYSGVTYWWLKHFHFALGIVLPISLQPNYTPAIQGFSFAHYLCGDDYHYHPGYTRLLEFGISTKYYEAPDAYSNYTLYSLSPSFEIVFGDFITSGLEEGTHNYHDVIPGYCTRYNSSGYKVGIFLDNNTMSLLE